MKNFIGSVFTMIAILTFPMFLQQCDNGSEVELQAPEITSVSSESGVEGTTLTITGKNFSATASANTVAFNGTDATVSAATTTSLIVSVPAGATTGKISVTVAGLTTKSAKNFTLVPSASIQADATRY